MYNSGDKAIACNLKMSLHQMRVCSVYLHGINMTVGVTPTLNQICANDVMAHIWPSLGIPMLPCARFNFTLPGSLDSRDPNFA